ncbi:MAG: AAA family ATPase [Patescibacteria group bacterium]
MFTRNIEKDLKEWKISTIRKPLILRGARQVGKTSVVRKFASENFDNLVEINLEQESQKEFLEGADNVDEFIRRSEILTNEIVICGKTLFFIDEIQESLEALKLLRFFAEEKPDLHLIVAGSLLEAKMSGIWSVPVGRIEYMYLYPMTFSEFLKALGEERYIEGNNFEISHDTLLNNLKNYLLVGGMPEAVSSFVKDNSFIKVQNVHGRLIHSYEDDLPKYSTVLKKKYLELVMDFGPKIAGGIYKYDNFGGSSYKSREVSDAIYMLSKVLLLKEIPSINSINLPIIPKYKRAKKMIWLDVGIVNFANRITTEILKGEYKGRIMEQFVGQTLLAKGLRRREDVVYWSRNKDEGSAEVDFCFQHEDKIVGIEVKSGNTKNLKSLFSMINIGGDIVLPVRVSWDKLGIEKYQHSGKNYKILNIPFYLLDRIYEFLNTLKTA